MIEQPMTNYIGMLFSHSNPIDNIPTRVMLIGKYLILSLKPYSTVNPKVIHSTNKANCPLIQLTKKNGKNLSTYVNNTPKNS